MNWDVLPPIRWDQGFHWDQPAPPIKRRYSRGEDVVYLALNAAARQLVANDGVTVAATWTEGALKDGTGTPFRSRLWSAAIAEDCVSSDSACRRCLPLGGMNGKALTSQRTS